MDMHQIYRGLIYPFEALVSPFTAFRKIAEKPIPIGIAVVLALFVATTAGAEYVTASKIILTINGESVRLLASDIFGSYLATSLFQTAADFLASWFVYVGILLLLLRLFGRKEENESKPWRPFLTIIGYVFVVFVVRMIAIGLLVSTLPDLAVPISTWPPSTAADYKIYTDQYNAVWAPTLVAQLTNVTYGVVYVWFVILGVIAIHASRERTWGQAATVVLAAFLTNFLLSLVLSTILPIGIML